MASPISYCSVFLFQKLSDNLQEHLIYFSKVKKSIAKVHQLLLEAYGVVALNEWSCEWLHGFRNGEFNVEHTECTGRSQVYEDTEMKVLMEKSLC